jgi:hypothetical protein
MPDVYGGGFIIDAIRSPAPARLAKDLPYPPRKEARQMLLGPLGASRLILASGRGSYSGLRHRSPISSKTASNPTPWFSLAFFARPGQIESVILHA